MLILNPDTEAPVGGASFVTGATIDTNAGIIDLASADATLSNATIINSTVNTSGGGSLVITTSNATFDGVTLNTPVSVPNNTAIFVQGDLTLDSVLTMGSTGSFTELRFQTNGATLGGSGEVVMGGSSTPNSVRSLSSDALTIGSNMTISGAAGTVSAGGVLTIDGTIDSDVAGTIIITASSSWSTSATGVLALNGGNLSLEGNWDHQLGTTNLNAGSLLLNGNFTTAGSGLYDGNFTRTGGAVALRGTVDNTGDVFGPTATTGDFSISIIGTRTIIGGTVTLDNGVETTTFGAGSALTLDSTGAEVVVFSGDYTQRS